MNAPRLSSAVDHSLRNAAKAAKFGIVIAHLSGRVHRLFKKEAAEKLRGGGFTASSRTETVTEQDVERLPEPVRKYLRVAGVVGKPRVRNARFVFEGDFKLSPKQKWIRETCS